MNKTYPTITEFKSHIDNNVKPALLEIGTNLKNINMLNKIGAMTLGFSSYEAIQPHHALEKNMKNRIYFSLCPYQRGLPTFKIGNAIIVFDENRKTILARSINPGQAKEMITLENKTACIDEAFENARSVDFNLHHDEITHQDNVDGVSAIFNLSSICSNGIKSHHICRIERKDNKVDLSICYDVQGDCGSNYFSFEITLDPEHQCQSEYLKLDNPNRTDITYYQWLRPTIEDGEMRYLTIGNHLVDDIVLSDIMFSSIGEAKEAIRTGIFGYDHEQVEDCVIVRVSKTIVS